MMYEHLGARPRIHDTAVVAPTAVISGDVQIGPNCQVLHGAVITAEGGPITLGEHVIVMENALIRATAADAVHIGDHTLVGILASIAGAALTRLLTRETTFCVRNALARGFSCRRWFLSEGSRRGCGQMTPCASIASATRSKPAMFAPAT